MIFDLLSCSDLDLGIFGHNPGTKGLNFGPLLKSKGAFSLRPQSL